MILSLKNEKDFKKVYSDGKRISGRYFRAVINNSELNVARLAVSASKKLGKAVTRNRIRRRIKEAFRSSLSETKGRAGVDVIIFPFISAKNACFSEIKQEIGRVLNRAGL